MYFFIISIGLLIVGIALTCLGLHLLSDIRLSLGLLGITFGTIGLAICLLFFIGNLSTSADVRITQNQIKYEWLCERLEAAEEKYEDITELVVYQEVLDWNTYVTNYKYNANNPWISCFYYKSVAEELKLIPIN